LPTYPNTYSRQQGSALVVAVFVIVVMGLIASALFALFGSASQSSAANVGGARAQFAAQSGLQAGYLKLFPLTGGAADCSVTNLTFSEEGLKNCSVAVECTEIAVVALSATLYRLQATGSCELGTETYSRKLLAEATDAND